MGHRWKNGKWHMANWLVTWSMTSRDLERSKSWTNIFGVHYRKNGWSYRLSYNRRNVTPKSQAWDPDISWCKHLENHQRLRLSSNETLIGNGILLTKWSYDQSMQGTKCWKVHSVGYYCCYLNLFSCCCCLPNLQNCLKAAKNRFPHLWSAILVGSFFSRWHPFCHYRPGQASWWISDEPCWSGLDMFHHRA